MTRILSYASLLFMLAGSLPALSQETLSGLDVNQKVRETYKNTPTPKSTGDQILEIPFFDDFSRSTVFPDPGKWSDRYAFINNDYPVNPISYNVATLDAIDHTGALYEHASVSPFIADRFTSKPLNLDYLPGDSIYLSFFYQPQGRGDAPQQGDSLRLEFYAPETEQWKVVWSVPGSEKHDFKLVMIPVLDTEYLMEGFRFRFSNIASIADNIFNPGAMSNGDHWHIDYVFLDKERTVSDTIFRDIAFVNSPGSLLNSYEAMPWRQFLAGRLAEMASVLPLTIRNNDIVPRTVTPRFTIENIYKNQSSSVFPGENTAISPGEIQKRELDLTYSFNSDNPDSALFRIRAWIETEIFDYKGNDTITYYQDFSNYFALDDGTAENGYGLFGAGTENGMISTRFRAYAPDSLRAVRIYFNQSLNNASRQYFRLAVWDDNNGRPGNLRYVQEGARPVYEDELNRFHTYILDSAIFVSQVFHVGIIQTTTDFLNIGFDINRNSRNRIFYNIRGNWVNTSFEGSLMIRPVTGNQSNWTPGSGGGEKMSMNVYPNPVREVLYIDLDPEIKTQTVTYSLFNSSGQLVFQDRGYLQSLDIRRFPPGIYYLHAEGENIEFRTRKILITQ